MVLVKTHIYMKLQNQNGIFLKNENSFNSFINTHINLVCECIWYLTNPPTNLSFTFYLKIKSWHFQTWHKSSWKTSLEGLLLLLDLVQTLIEWARLLLSTWCNLDARALESTRASSKTLTLNLLLKLNTKILIKYLILIKYKIISIITTWVNHHQN